MLMSLGLDYSVWAFFVCDFLSHTLSFTYMRPHFVAWPNSRTIFISTYGIFWINGFVRLRCEL
jgi:hypothetical protein